MPTALRRRGALRARYYSRRRIHNLMLHIIAALLANRAAPPANRSAAQLVLLVLLRGPVELGLFFLGGVVVMDGDFLAELGVNVLL